jgi:hypothetical protein
MPKFEAIISAFSVSPDRRIKRIFIEAANADEAARMAGHTSIKTFPPTNPTTGAPMHTHNTAKLVDGPGVSTHEGEDDGEDGAIDLEEQQPLADGQ